MYDFSNDKDLTNMTDDELLEYLLEAKRPIFIGGKAKNIDFVITEEGQKPSIEEIK